MADKVVTKQEIAELLQSVDELFSAISKTKQGLYLGHLNEICLFLEAAQRTAPEATNG